MIQFLMNNGGMLLGLVVMLLQLIAIVLHLMKASAAEASVESIIKALQDAGIKVPSIPAPSVPPQA